MNSGLIIVVLVAAGLFLLRMKLLQMRNRTASEEVAGPAIVEFGEAFPGEAIRAVVTTEDMKSVFLRLADGKTGFLELQNRRDIARIIEPGTVRATDPVGDKSLSVELDGPESPARIFTFSSPQDAAEVALWLFGTFSMAAGASGSRGK